MKELLTSDIYQIRSSYMLDDISYKTTFTTLSTNHGNGSCLFVYDALFRT